MSSLRRMPRMKVVLLAFSILLSACANTSERAGGNYDGISPERLYWPNTVTRLYDSKGKMVGYAVTPAMRRK